MIKKLILALAVIFCFCTFCDTVDAQWPWGQRRIIGYQPNITWLPQGTTLNVNRVHIDPHRRIVTMGINAQFYHIPQVRTFNFYGSQPNINYNYNYNYNHNYNNWRR